MPRTVSSARMLTLACVAVLILSSAVLGAHHGVTQGGWIALMGALTFNLLRSGPRPIPGSQLLVSMLVFGLLGIACIALQVDTLLGRFVPAYFQALLAMLVARTLLPTRVPAIERIAVALNPAQSFAEEQRGYMRRVTWLWFGVFAGLSVIHAVAALSRTVMLQNELSAFALDLSVITIVFVLEFAWRRRRYADQTDDSLLHFVMNLRRIDPLKLLLS